MDGTTFSNGIYEATTSLRMGHHDIAMLHIYTLFVSRLTREARVDEVSPEDEFENLLLEATTEMVIALADQTGAPCRHVTETVDRFISTHLSPQKDAILSEVVSNLEVTSVTQRVPSRLKIDNDVVV